MAGGAITIHDASATDTILSVKERVFAVNRKMSVRRQRLVYSAGPHGMKPLANTKTLSGAGVAQDGSAKLDVLLVDLTAEELKKLSVKVFKTAVLEDPNCRISEYEIFSWHLQHFVFDSVSTRISIIFLMDPVFASR